MAGVGEPAPGLVGHAVPFGRSADAADIVERVLQRPLDHRAPELAFGAGQRCLADAGRALGRRALGWRALGWRALGRRAPRKERKSDVWGKSVRVRVDYDSPH